MDLSIIIATRNSLLDLPNCLQSIFHCIKSSFEYEILIADGNSADNTCGYIQSLNNSFIRVVSRDDTGIYDAWNKALSASTGRWILFLGSDDLLLSSFLSYFYWADSPQNSVYNLITSLACYGSDSANYTLIGKSFNKVRLIHSMGIVNCSTLYKSSLFSSAGFSTGYRIAGDYEFIVRNRHLIYSVHYASPTTFMNSGGISSTLVVQAFNESFRLRSHHFKKSFLYLLIIYSHRFFFQFRLCFSAIFFA